MLKENQNSKKIILITGASQGIGKTCAIKFLKEGYKVAVLARNKNKLESTFNNFESSLILPCDVSNYDQVTQSFEVIKKRWGRLDVLFNNAGIGLKANTPENISFKDWKRVIEINLNGSFICAQNAFKMMKEQNPQGGRIINNGSVSAHVPRPGSSPYTASKHAITGLTKSISLDGRPFNIACSQIDIGNALTDMVVKMKSGISQADGSIKPEATMDPCHVANSVYYITQLPLDVNIQFMTVMATSMPYIGRG